MGMRINSNIQSLVAQRQLSKNRGEQDKSLAKMSSGQRINSAGDDAAGLAISENLKSEITRSSLSILMDKKVIFSSSK